MSRRVLLQECWFIHFTPIQFLSYFYYKAPDAIMIPSGILAKVTASSPCKAFAIAIKACSPSATP